MEKANEKYHIKVVSLNTKGNVSFEEPVTDITCTTVC